nr:carboxypeptidase-like regulatory domain-containing protein [uncultured Methanospirillum sp.]
MEHRKLRLVSGGILLLLCLLATAPVCGLNIMVFEQTDRTAPIPQALIYTNGEYAATTNENGTYNLSYEGVPPALRIAKAGYREWTGTPLVNDTLLLVPLQIRNCTYSIQVFDADTLLPLPDLQVKASLADGTVRQNHTSSNGSVLLPLRTEQVYDLTITGGKYQTIRDKLVTGFENTAVQYSMIRNDRISLLVQDAQTKHPVADVQVFTDGKDSGKTNEKGILITNMSRGVDHMIEARSPGYEKTILQKNPGEEDLILDVALIPLKSTVFVSVYDPAKQPIEGAEIRIDGESAGSTTQYGRISIPDLELRSYLISVSKKGYKPESRTVDLTSNNSDIIFDLTPDLISVPVMVKDSQGRSLPNASVLVNGSQMAVSNGNGSTVLALKEKQSYHIGAELVGYLQNNTTIIPPVSTPVILVLSPKEKENVVTPFPLMQAGIIVLVVVALLLILYFRGGGKRPSSRARRRRIDLRKRSL